MVVVQKDVFWKAAIITLIVFTLGVITGFILESSRISEIQEEYKQVEVEWADSKLQSIYFQLVKPEFCNLSITENSKFADRVYEQGLRLERYESANKLREEQLLYEKKRYALLKLEFWLNSIKLKEKCNANYINLVYFYSDNPDINTKAKQDTQSVILRELKDEYASNLMLIPLPIDLDIMTINIIKNTYNITTTPTLLINEKIKLEGLYDLEELKKIVNKQIS